MSKDYLADFDWVDQIHHIKNPSLIEKLETTHLRNFNENKFTNLWMAVPDLIDWTELKGFKYLPKEYELSDDLDIIEFRNAVGEIEDLNKIRYRHVSAISTVSETKIAHWNVFKCLYGEIKYRQRQYVLNNGKWYEIDKDFVTKVNNSYSRIKLSTIDLPDYNHENEGEYNSAVANTSPQYLLMDKKEIIHGGGKSAIEFCDIFSKDKLMIHVKHYGASAVLSHLFQQGMNSGEYLVSDPDFRRKLNNKLDTGWKLRNPDARINPEEFEVIFAIISRKKDARPNIPFFSRVSIKNVARRLRGFRYQVSLKKITSLKD